MGWQPAEELTPDPDINETAKKDDIVFPHDHSGYKLKSLDNPKALPMSTSPRWTLFEFDPFPRMALDAEEPLVFQLLQRVIPPRTRTKSL
jgi:hypothetical protein